MDITSSSSPTILFVDDNEDDIELYNRFIKKDPDYNWSVVAAKDGLQALEKYQSTSVLCVLLDYSLPGSDGIAILEKIKQINPYAAVIILTGQGSESIAVKAMQGGAQDYLAKDALTSEGLIKAVHDAIKRTELFTKVNEQQRELEDFSRILAHDLKEPARHIIQLAELITEDDRSQLSDDSQRYIRLMCESAERLKKLIDAMTVYTRLDTRPPEFTTVATDKAVESAIKNLTVLIKERDAVIRYKNLPVVYGQEVPLAQLFQNLIGNAIKYCPEKTPDITISATTHGNQWEFVVADNGIGIEPIYTEKIFQPFRRLHSADIYPGTGLGLATCKKIIKRHSGDIWCESETGKGARFYFWLPDSTQTH